MATARTARQALQELRRIGAPRLRRAPGAEVAPLIARVISECRTASVERRAGGIAFLLSVDGEPGVSVTCVVHEVQAQVLTVAEQAVAAQLCEGRTLAQIASLRGVTTNTVKSQVRQIFRKLNVENRVALVRRLLD